MTLTDILGCIISVTNKEVTRNDRDDCISFAVEDLTIEVDPDLVVMDRPGHTVATERDDFKQTFEKFYHEKD